MGLFLGLCLEEAGISYLILEKRSAPRPGSRSLGIHPVSLELFEELGIAERFIRDGIKIKKGHAFANTKKIGTLSFDSSPKPFNYILAIPQQQTEMLLEKYLIEQNSEALLRGAEVTSITEHTNHVDITFQHNNKQVTIQSDYLTGCDGKNSLVRKQAGIDFKGQKYPDTYSMGDFPDNTDFGDDAAIFLCDEGLVESFPLPQNRRRWVVKTDGYIENVTKQEITKKVFNRTRHSLDGTQHFMLSSFGVQNLIADPMVKNRIILCGDAAHIVSPIGGQGMNLGWLDAHDLADTLIQLSTNPYQAHAILNLYQKRRLHAAKNASRRAELNMRLGRKTGYTALRNGLVSLMVNTPLSKLMSNIFTMRGVERWIV